MSEALISPWRNDFPAFQDDHFYYLDSASSAQKPHVVLKAMHDVSAHNYANVSRGLYRASQDLTSAYEGARATVTRFINAHHNEVVIAKNATEAMNIVAYSWGGFNLKKGDRIILSEMEHHAGIVPWQLLQERIGFEIDIWPVTKLGTLNLDVLEKLIKPETKLLSFVAVSNVLGAINPVQEIVQKARSLNKDITICVDGTQAVVHGHCDVKAWDVDFMAFTGHKLYGPTGVGILYGREEKLNVMPPFLGGGDMIDVVDFKGTTYKSAPHRFEAGTPPFIEMIALGKAIDYMRNIGFDTIEAYEHDLSVYLYERLEELDFVTLMPSPKESRIGVASFVLDNIHAQDAAMILDQMGVCIRVGHHCAMPLMKALGQDATMRASIGLYTNGADIDRLIEGLEKAKRMLL